MRTKTTTTLDPASINKIHEAKVLACTRHEKFVSLGHVIDTCVAMADMEELIKSLNEKEA